MDKYYKVLNALLDEIDYLDKQLNEALNEHDYELADHLQKAYYYKKQKLCGFKGIFDPILLSPYHPSDKYVVNNRESEKALQYILGDLVSGRLRKVQIILEKDMVERGAIKSVEINIISRSQIIAFILQNFTSEWNFKFEKPQLKKLNLIGWQADDLESQKFSLNISKGQNSYQEKILEVLARTYFEVIAGFNNEMSCFVNIKP